MKADPNTSLRKRPRVAHVQPKVCLACGAPEGYRTVTTTRNVELKGELIAVTYDCQECPSCEHRVLTDTQMDNRIRLTVAAYQRKHGLLTAEDVASRRKAIGCATQQSLVEATPAISIATLKRIEAGQHVQDPATDFLLRRALAEVETKRKESALIELLSVPFSEIEDSDTVSLRGGVYAIAGWRGWCAAALPLAACVTLVATVPGSHSAPHGALIGAEVVGC